MDLSKLYAAAKRQDAGGDIMFHLPDMGIARAPFAGRFLIAGTNDGFRPSDHGTMIAGILFDWCPKAALVSYRVASDVDPLLTNGGRLLDAFDRIIQTVERYTAYRHIVSVSQATDNLGEIQLERFHGQIRRLAALGALVVCAAGNDGEREVTKYPASWPEPVCVTACDNTGSRAGFSSVLNEADCCAWGRGIISRDACEKPCIGSGTSYAAPQVAGMAGMIWQDGMTTDTVWNKLKAACMDTGTKGLDPYYGWGVVDPTRLFEEEQTIEQEERFLEQQGQTKKQRFYEAARQAVGGLYVWGGQGHQATEAYIRGRAAKYPQYFTGGRLEMMLNRAKEHALSCWDCSGLVCWALINMGAQEEGFDTTANGLYKNCCTPVTREELQTGDLLFKKSGSRMAHVGIYGEAGCIEAAGGAYGVVLCSGLSGKLHTAKSLVNGKTYQLSDWTHYGRLKCLEETTVPAASLQETAAFGLVTGNVHLRTSPSAASASKGVLKKGSCIVMMPAVAGWQRAAGFINGAAYGGYVSEKYVEVKPA